MLLLAAGMADAGVFAIVIVIGLVLFGLVYAARRRNVGPNEALIISGWGSRRADGRVGFKIVTGGGAFIKPILEKADVLSLEVMTLDIRLADVYAGNGIPISVDGVAQVKVDSKEEMIATAAEQFLSKSPSEMLDVARQTLEGHLRAIIGTMTIEQIYKEREKFAQNVQEMAATDLANMGLRIVSFTLRDIKDGQGYLDALGRPRIAQVRAAADIAEQESKRDAIIKTAQANQDGQEKKLLADTRVAESQRDFEMKKAEYQMAVNQRRAAADLAYDLEKYKKGQEVKKEEIQVQVIDREMQIEVQEKEIARREKELEATIIKPANAERMRIQTLADAEKYKMETEAAGRAAATRNLGIGDADAEKAKGLAAADVQRAHGLAEAAIIAAKGQAEAESMSRKADAWKAYNEAAIIQMFIEKLPEIARAIAEPLGKTEKIVMVSTGGEGVGASKLTGEIAKIMAQLPDVIESLSGIKLKDVIGKMKKDDGGGAAAAAK